MGKLIPKERIIYDNYNLSRTFPDDEVKEAMIENEVNEDEITDDLIWEWRYREDSNWWDDEKTMLDDYFKNCYKLMAFGNVGLWHGVYVSGFLFENVDELLSKGAKDCDYWKFYDENGHLYLHCSHHDGSCTYEIKEITKQGIRYLENWEYDWNDNRTEQYVHTQIFKRYSKLPRYAEKVFGCKAREYEKQSKEVFMRVLANQARSFYS